MEEPRFISQRKWSNTTIDGYIVIRFPCWIQGQKQKKNTKKKKIDYYF